MILLPCGSCRGPWSALRAALLTASMGALVACSGPPDSERLDKARAYIEQHDNAAASIELKNLLQNNPQSGEARFLLGKLLFEGGDAAGAEIELRRAREAGHAEDAVMPLLARVLLAQNKPELLLQAYGGVDLDDDLAAAEFQTLLANAHLAGNATAEAEAAIGQALQRMPDHAPAVLLQARILASRGDIPGALAMVEGLLDRQPQLAEAWGLRGDLQLVEKPSDTARALETYRKALAVQPDLVAAHAAVLTLLVRSGDFAAAGQQLQDLQKRLPRHPETRYFEALMALRDADAKRARELLEPLLGGSAPHPKVLLLAGQAEMQLNSLIQAEALLGRALKATPQAVQPRRMLAQIYLRTGEADKALAVLEPLLSAGQADAGVLSLAGRAQLMTGDAKAAEASFARATRLQPQDKRLQASAALARLGQGQGVAAMGELEAIAATDSGTTADLALISLRLRRQEWEAASRAIDALAAKQPQQALPDFLRGRIAAQRRDTAGAQRHFEAALAKEPGFFQAVVGLASLDVAAGRLDAARQRFEAVLAQEPGHASAHLALADLKARSGGSRQEVTQLLEAGIKARPETPVLRAALIDHHMRGGDTALALAAAQTAVATVTDNPELLDRLGRVQQASGDINQAIVSFNRAAALQPRSALPHLRLADAHKAAKNADAAAASVRRAMEADPRSLPAQRAGVLVALQENKFTQAQAIARTVQAQRPDEAVGYLIEGEIELAQRNFDNAAAAYRKAMSKPNSAEAAPRLHLALLGAKKTAEAERLAASWLKSHPDDIVFQLHLADTALGQRQLAQAQSRYRAILERQPDNVLALNNLAYVLTLLKQPGATALAEKAVQLAPDQPALMDTLALAYAREDQLAKAVELQSRVVQMAPEAPDFRLNLARMQLQAGNKDAARALLDKLGELGTGYARHEEVDELRKGLGG